MSAEEKYISQIRQASKGKGVVKNCKLGETLDLNTDDLTKPFDAMASYGTKFGR